MSNPKLMAEDVARHYMEKISNQYTHSTNIRRYLRLPVLAITRRILLPRFNYAQMNQSDAGSFGADVHVDPSLMKCKEGLDWRDYISSKSLNSSDAKSETEISESSDDNMRYYSRRQPKEEMKLTRRSLARLEAFLASCALAVPEDRILPFRGNHSNDADKIMFDIQSFAKSFSSLTTSQQNKTKTSTQKKKTANGKINNTHTYPQIDINDLTLRIELYIRNLRRIYAVREQQDHDSHDLTECVIQFEPPKAIHARIHILLNSLISTTNSVVSMRPILTKLLTHLTRELLAVEHLSEELVGYIRKIVLEYEHLTSFASLAFLSSPGDSAETHLAPLLLNYLEYLRNDVDICVDQCKLETTLARAVHPGMRKVFKTAEFASLGHLLEVCRKYKDQLENISISPRDSPSFGIEKTFASRPSLSSDVIASITSGDATNLKKCGSSTTKAIKQALRDLRREIITVNGHVLPPVQSLTQLVNLLRERLQTRTVKLKEKKVAYNRKNLNIEVHNDQESSGSSDQLESDSGKSYYNDSDIISSGNEGDMDGSPRSSKNNQRTGQENASTHFDPASPRQRQEGPTKNKRRPLNVNAIDIMTRRLLLAASRTGCGGDAFFVVRDLFGGEGVEVIQAPVAPMGPYIHGKVSPTIELSVRLASIVIKCHSTFNVYPEPYTGECEALIQLHTTTTETIELQEVRVDDDGNEINLNDGLFHNDVGKKQATRLMLKEKKTENSGRKFLFIRPAKYERVENWHTPS